MLWRITSQTSLLRRHLQRSKLEVNTEAMRGLAAQYSGMEPPGTQSQCRSLVPMVPVGTCGEYGFEQYA